MDTFFACFLYLGIPTICAVLFTFSLIFFLSAKAKNRKVPGTYSPQVIRRRKLFLIVTAIVAGVLFTVIVGFLLLLLGAVAYM